MKKLFCLLLPLALLFSMFCGCGEKKPDDTASGGDPDKLAEQIVSKADINFVNADGDSTYRLIRAEGAVSTASVQIFKAIKEAFDVSAMQSEDTLEADGTPEILIGNTNRESTKKALELFNAEANGRSVDYMICSVGNDIVIVGNSEEAIVNAGSYFVENYINGSVITGGIHYLYSPTEGFKELSIAGTTKMSAINFVRPIYNVSYLTQHETDLLMEYITENTGYEVKLVHDQVASATGKNQDGSGTLTPTEASEYEVIIGNCVRDGVKTFTDRNAYEIRIEGKKIYLNGGSPYATAMAVSEFYKLVENNTTITDSMSVLNGDYNAVIGNYDTATYYRKTWGDDFDGTAINEAVWDCNWDANGGYDAPSNGKMRVRGSSTLKNNYVKDGYLYIDGVETDTAYYGGMLRTNKSMEYLYGLIEISNLHPMSPEPTFWTSLWMTSNCGTIYNSETDVDECYGYGTWVYGNTFAWPTALGKQVMQVPEGSTGAVHVNNRHYSEDDRGFWMDFHTYGFEWLDNTHVRFSCDGYVYADQQLREGAEQLAYSLPMSLRLSMACGTGNHGDPTSDPYYWENTNQFINDYVHIYQVDGQELFTDYNKETGKFNYGDHNFDT